MATRNFVPRADGEGKLGTPSKKWGDVYTTTVHGDLDGNASSATLATNATNDADGNPISSIYVKKDSDYLGYRQPSTAYTTGAMAYHATLPAGWFLECTTAGTTGSGTLTITTPTVGGTVSDGTVTWTIRKNASTQDLTGYLPLSGGVMIKSKNTPFTELKSKDDNGAIVIRGGSNWRKGATIAAHGQDFDTPSLQGAFELEAYKKNIGEHSLTGYPNGTLLWDDNSLDKSAVVAESLGKNGYRKYASGLIEQWGRFRNVSEGYMPAGGYTVTFPISFTAECEPSVSATDHVLLAVPNVAKNGMNVTFSGQVFELYWRAIGY